MESTRFARSGSPLCTISMKALNFQLSGDKHLSLACFSPASSGGFQTSLRSLGGSVSPVIRRRRLQCLSSGHGAGFGGYNGGGGSGGGGRGGGSDNGDSKSKLGAGASDGVSVPSSDIIILNVGGMTCGGCSASVKKILESQPQVASASVNLTTETAIVWPIPEAKSLPDWQKTLGETLANHLTNCGFQSSPRGEVPEDIAGEFAP